MHYMELSECLEYGAMCFGAGLGCGFFIALVIVLCSFLVMTFWTEVSRLLAKLLDNYNQNNNNQCSDEKLGQ